MLHLFIDANIFVKFFEIDSDAFNDLEKLITLVEKGDSTLWLPEQTKREFWNNRENNVKKSIRDFSNSALDKAIPLLVREHSRFKSLDRKQQEVHKLRTEIAKELEQQIDAQSTRADQMIRRLFDAANQIDTDADEIFVKSHRRALAHLPPGKKDVIGDRLAWVALLQEVPQKAELHVVSDDSDFRNEGFNNEIRPYLKWEWENKKQGKIFLWTRISQFIASRYPRAKNSIDLERQVYIKQLRESLSFAQTHEAIASLNKLSGFELSHALELIEVASQNSQVDNIMVDNDVFDFYSKLVHDFETELDEKSRDWIKGRLNRSKEIRDQIQSELDSQNT